MGDKPYFNKEITNIIKGIALIMMFIHHFFTFPSWWLDGISYPIIEKVAPYFCEPFKLCVPIFCFLTGYVYYFNKTKNYKYSLRKITDIILSYWSVFFIFALTAIANGYNYSLAGFVKELFALQRPTMTFCWYVYFYYSFMLIMPVVVKTMSKNIHIDAALSAIIIPFTFRVMQYFFSWSSVISGIVSSLALWFPTVLAGFIFAKYDLFEKIETFFARKNLSKIKWAVIYCVLLVFLPMGRYFAPHISVPLGELPIIHKSFSFSISLDIVYTPLFIYAVVNLCKSAKGTWTWIEKTLVQIGKQSLLMWFVSCIFFNNTKSVFQPLLYFPHNPILVLAWGLIVCFAASVAIDFVLSKLIYLKNRLFFK